MGIYDIYGQSQLKVGDVSMKVFTVGDKSPLPDGVYVDYGGVTVIKGGIFVAEFPCLYTKWGDLIDQRGILDNDNPVAVAMKEFNG